ncbi:hypothetical protein ACFJIY_25155 [Pimelobacter simplex]|uniref:hypothetical protein n=1 Tax=Nocardioides simplex TaxID=2045 RepID=UPI00367332C8
MRLVGALIAAALLLAACGGEDKSEAEAAPNEAPSSNVTESGLDVMCPRLQAVATTDDFAEASDLQAAASELDAIETDGDASVDRIVVDVRPGILALLDYANAGRPAGEGLDAFSKFTDARQAVRKACG